MNVNCGGVDRVMRTVAGAGLISIVFVGPQTPWGWAGIGALLTGISGHCPLYTLLGLSTCAARAKKR